MGLASRDRRQLSANRAEEPNPRSNWNRCSKITSIQKDRQIQAVNTKAIHEGFEHTEDARAIEFLEKPITKWAEQKGAECDMTI